MTDAWLVVGLGNPGPTYALTRHNIGFRVVDELAKRHGASLSKHKRAQADVAEFKLNSQSVILVKPMTFMNTSGGPTKALASFYKVTPDRIIVLHDELDIECCTIRVKFGGGDNGHNGLKSIRNSFGSGDWYRIRLGIGRPLTQQDPASYVLQKFAVSEQSEVELLIDRGADAVEMLISSSLEETQNRFNS